MPLEFQECASCAAKLGSPVLCPGCQHNRSVIAELSRKTPATWPELRRRQFEDRKTMIKDALARNLNSVEAAAADLGISRQNLRMNTLRHFGLNPTQLQDLPDELT